MKYRAVESQEHLGARRLMSTPSQLPGSPCSYCLWQVLESCSDLRVASRGLQDFVGERSCVLLEPGRGCACTYIHMYIHKHINTYVYRYSISF